MNSLPSHLRKNECAAVVEFAQRISHFLEGDLCEMWLFGSKARGDFTDDSDLDILIVLRRLNPKLRGEIQRLAARISLDFDTLINTHIKENADWDKIVQYEATLWREVKRDGISLDDLVSQFEPLPSRS